MITQPSSSSVPSLAFGGVAKRAAQCLKLRRAGRKRRRVVDGGAAESGPDGDDDDDEEVLDLTELARRRKRGEALTEKEERLYRDSKEMLDLICEYERAPVKSVKQGLGSTFYEYNELALQYGYVLMFAIALPIAPLLALANNLVEVRSDALKMVYAARRIRAEPAVTIGPWSGALKFISYAAVVVNLAYLAITSDFFERLEVAAPVLDSQWVRILLVVGVEHAALGCKLLVDRVIPDVPDDVKTKLARDEYVAVASVRATAGAAKLKDCGKQIKAACRFNTAKQPPFSPLPGTANGAGVA